MSEEKPIMVVIPLYTLLHTIAQFSNAIGVLEGLKPDQDVSLYVDTLTDCIDALTKRETPHE